MTLYLARHGATDWSVSGQHTGRTDIALNAQGEAQARALLPRLQSMHFSRVLVSPLVRAMRTAQLAGLGDRAEAMPDLLEVDYGRDEGRTRVEIQRERPGWDLLRDGPEGGETIAQAAARARAVIELAARSQGDVLAVAHGHILRILAACYLGEQPVWARHLVLGTASLSALGQEHGVSALTLWNDQQHLRAAGLL